jgi:hypothetical protein
MEITQKNNEAVLNYAVRVKNSIKAKSDTNKNLASFLFCVILISTVFSPALILLPFDVIFSKYLPALLTACAALASYWMQLRKPQERWVLYRTAQREIEYEIDQYQFETGEYSDLDKKDSLLADKVSKRALQLHYEWIPMDQKLKKLTN